MVAFSLKLGETEYLLEIWTAELILIVPMLIFNLAMYEENYDLFLTTINLLVGIYSVYSVATLVYWTRTKVQIIFLIT